jgi:hypothetical protein
VNPNYNFTIPFLTSDTFASFGAVSERYFERHRELFAFDVDNPECCQQRAAADESVFHLRNFLIEMPNVGVKMGFEELSPNKTANELFGHLQAGDKVAITSRFTDYRSNPYVDAFHARGIAARIVKGQNPEQDFCFLLSAQKEMVGVSMSSFAHWASRLGNATVAKLYSVKCPAKLKQFPNSGGVPAPFTSTNKVLAGKIKLPIFSSEEQDKVEENI